MAANPTGACVGIVTDLGRTLLLVWYVVYLGVSQIQPLIPPVSGLRDRDVFAIPVGESSICLYVSCCKRMLLGWLAIDANI